MKREKQDHAKQQGDQRNPPMNRLELDDRLFHFSPLDLSSAPSDTWRGGKRYARFRKRVYRLQSRITTQCRPFLRRAQGIFPHSTNQISGVGVWQNNASNDAVPFDGGLLLVQQAGWKSEG
ncbi:MAG TPA: hypothetical protein VGB07_20900 [Blastocatellia bacterium]